MQQKQESAAMGWDAVVIHPEDSVAVAVRDLDSVAHVLQGASVHTLPLLQPVPMGHKFALRDWPAGHEVRKYGEVIGTATSALAQGEHVHVHNLASRRATASRPK